VRCLNCRKDGLALETQICPQCGVHLPPLMRDLLSSGTLLQGGHYRVDYALGQGGFGITYRAFDVNLERPVAIKEFYPQGYVQRDSTTEDLIIPSSTAESYHRWLGRFEREGRILARLTHPGIVKVFSLFKERNTAYLVMELLQGGTLGDALNAQPEKCFSEPRVVEIMEALVAALDTVHQEGVYHLDLKPDNVMVTGDGRIVLVDFGSARQDLSSMSSSKKSSTLAITPDYAPPELLSGQAVGAESDLFQLGMMLHEMLTGSRPPAVLSRLNQELWSPPTLDDPWQSLVTQALRLQRENRPAQVKQWWQTQVNWGQNQQQPEVQSQLRQEAEQQRERPAQVEKVARTRAESAKLKPAEKAVPVPTPAVTPLVWMEPKPARQLNRRGLLLAGLGATGLGGAWLVNQVIRHPSGSQALSPAPFTTPSSFSFEVVTANDAGKVISRAQSQARYFTEDLGEGITLEMIAIRAGEFVMGSPEGELNRENDEGPQRQVKVKGFSMGRFTVTQAQWQAVMGYNNNPAYFRGANRPVEQVSWSDAQVFCKKLSQQTGRTYRLPSEAEWEYACRAGTTTPFHFGPMITTDLANYYGDSTYGSGSKGQYRQQTAPLGSFPANGFGLHDMHGNVWEWCQDTYHQNYSGAPTDGSAWVSGGDNRLRILRSGSWLNDPWYCRSASRHWYNSENRSNDLGFRVVCLSPWTS
jgi:eukaryotic-like serine/threonine-protein kinase